MCSSNRELLPHVLDAWMDHTKTPIGGEIPFTRHSCRLQPRRLLEEIRGDLKTLLEERRQTLNVISRIRRGTSSRSAR